jgi:hypothetical protein
MSNWWEIPTLFGRDIDMLSDIPTIIREMIKIGTCPNGSSTKSIEGAVGIPVLTSIITVGMIEIRANDNSPHCQYLQLSKLMGWPFLIRTAKLM